MTLYYMIFAECLDDDDCMDNAGTLACDTNNNVCVRKSLQLFSFYIYTGFNFFLQIRIS